MDNSLRSLLTSSVGDLMDTDGSLSEIARSILIDKSAQGANSVREKAGLLALINLLGIVDAFYKETDTGEGRETVQVSQGAASAEIAKTPKATEAAGMAEAPRTTGPDPALDALMKAPPSALPQSQPSAQPQWGPEGPVSIVSSLSKLLGGAQAPAHPEGPSTGEEAPDGTPSLGSILSSLDPSAIAGMVGALASLAKPRPARQTGKIGETPSDISTSTAPDPAPPSPLHQALGIDPKILTLILNVAAEFMKNRNTEPKDKPGETRTPAEKPAKLQVSGPHVPGERPAKPQITKGFPGQEPSARRSAFRPHRPGLGISRSPRVPEMPEVKPQRA